MASLAWHHAELHPQPLQIVKNTCLKTSLMVFQGRKYSFAIRVSEFEKNRQRREPRGVEYITQEKRAFISMAPWKGQLCFSPHAPWNFTPSGRASVVFLEVVGGRRIKQRQISPEQHFFFLSKDWLQNIWLSPYPVRGKFITEAESDP